MENKTIKQKPKAAVVIVVKRHRNLKTSLYSYGPFVCHVGTFSELH